MRDECSRRYKGRDPGIPPSWYPTLVALGLAQAQTSEGMAHLYTPRSCQRLYLLVSIDPAKATVWWAYWNESARLEKCGRLKIKSPYQVAQWFGHHYPQTVLAIEKPMIRKAGRFGQARPSDIIDLAVAVGWCQAAPWLEVVEYLPNQWKGQLSKHMSNSRTHNALSRMELDVVAKAKVPQSLLHNIYDAIGIGIHFLRMKGFRT
jgi:hypothetical protein